MRNITLTYNKVEKAGWFCPIYNNICYGFHYHWIAKYGKTTIHRITCSTEDYAMDDIRREAVREMQKELDRLKTRKAFRVLGLYLIRR